jgi:dissimilatory sulfite reductase (desulfoviridin) alpha/beta subunit
MCVKNCASKAITLDAERKAVIDHDLCTGCCQCVAVCQFAAARASEETRAAYAASASPNTPGLSCAASPRSTSTS